MRFTLFAGRLALVAAVLVMLVVRALPATPPRLVVPGAHNVLTHHNDTQRTGQVLNETVLTPTSIFDPANQGANFGRIFSHAVDGYVYAQPLYVENVPILNRGTHNVVFVATQHDSIYAFDADNTAGANVLPLWHTNFLDPANGITTVSSDDVNTGDIVPEIGITGTPVIDAVNGVLYVVAKTKEPALVGQGVRFVQRLHAINIHTGLDGPGSPIEIQASVPGTGDGSIFQNGQNVVLFDPLREGQRPALLFLNGAVYIGWASHGDNGPYHGWLLGYKYDGNSFTSAGVFNTDPNGGLCGIWMAGSGPAADTNGNIFFETGNGTFDATSQIFTVNNKPQYYPAAGDFGDSFLKINSNNNALTFMDNFTPSNQLALSDADEDLGSGGVLVLPDTNPDGMTVGNAMHPHIMIGSGKEGKIYLVDRDNLGQYGPFYNPPLADGSVMETASGFIGGTWSMPAYFNGHIYYQGAGDVLKSFTIANGTLTGPVSSSNTGFGFPGATPSISANGTTNGIVWVLQTDGYGNSSPTVLHAYDATDLTKELYNSNQAPNGRDVPGGAVKFTVPTIANGRVYVGSQGQLTVYGLNPGQGAPLQPVRFDFNVDGHADLIFQSQSNGSIAYVTLNGLKFLSSNYLFNGVPLDYKVVGAPDLNRDGKPDLLLQSPSTRKVTYALVNGLSYSGKSGYLFDSVPNGFAVAGTPDLNGDGRPDILFQNQATGDVAYVLLNGLIPGASGYLFQGLDRNLKLVGTPDLNADGHPDLLFENMKTGDVLYALMNGTVPLSPTSYGTILRGVSLEYQIVGTPDLNADGSEDIVFQGQTNGDVSYLLMDGVTPFSFGYLFHGVSTDFKVVGVH